MNSTAQNLEEAIREHVSVTAEGAYLTDWVLVAAAADVNHADATTYMVESSDCPVHHKLGLIDYVRSCSGEFWQGSEGGNE